MEIPLPPPPKLQRSYASFAGAEREVSEESRKLTAQVLTAYEALPFKGPVLELVPGVIAVHDMWEANLRDELMDRQEAETVAQFSLEDWLKAKVETEGTDDQRARLAALLEAIPPAPPATFAEQRVDDGFYSNGLPTDIMSVVHQPLVEIPVYRDFQVDDIPVEDVVGQSQDDDDETVVDSTAVDSTLGCEEEKSSLPKYDDEEGA
mmetsp:Transcript_22396/g.68969  ORF Transcript_22396/g.68969 Transcript_22396/m.68969 type:complete len:206 (+) Transcript_22396:214-831(+)|eukprot:CAMPEP_0198644020 /NCGR_PEP_ID=MMETSP1467-20131203/342_1 /TAXON_ID=1462469 /ORGANISM="unid. sp., Strain CCMP2135" /LENGTH=205 /DNA_ID=CAMNT_0044379461 /DNA_START=184 /DNA_END=801 /DNA_ORIENTATION=+